MPDPFKVVAYVENYPPRVNAGAEATVHRVLQVLKGANFDCVVCASGKDRWIHEGIRVVPEEEARREMLTCHAVITQLASAPMAVKLADSLNLPAVHLLHLPHTIAMHNYIPRDIALAVFNSNWMATAQRWSGPAFTLYPATPLEDYSVERKTPEYVTLVGLSPNKGGPFLQKLARQLPEARFLGIQGGYGQQYLDQPSNVKVVPNTSAIQNYYAQTRLLICPSGWETWGRVVIEACCSGIPVIASPTPGLRESLGSAGQFLELEDISLWVERIRCLSKDPELYGKWSEAALRRARELDQICKKQEQDFIAELTRLIRDWPEIARQRKGLPFNHFFRKLYRKLYALLVRPVYPND